MYTENKYVFSKRQKEVEITLRNYAAHLTKMSSAHYITYSTIKPIKKYALRCFLNVAKLEIMFCIGAVHVVVHSRLQDQSKRMHNALQKFHISE